MMYLGGSWPLTCKEKKQMRGKKLGELQAKLEGIKINKDVALTANKWSKQGSTSKSKTNKRASTSKPKAIKQVQERVETTSSSSESEHDDDCGGINPYTLMAKLGPAQIDGFGPPKDDVRPG